MRLDLLMPEAALGEVEVTDLAYDNRVVRPGTLFFCVPGFTRDGHEFAGDAVGRGAVALVVERPLGLGVPEIRVRSVRASERPRLHGLETVLAGCPAWRLIHRAVPHGLWQGRRGRRNRTDWGCARRIAPGLRRIKA